MRIAVIGTLLIGLIGCSQKLDDATDEEVLITACMNIHMNKQALKLFGPINKDWCDCQLEVIQETVSPDIYKQIAAIIRSGESPHFMHAATLISRVAENESDVAIKAWVPICKPLR